MQARSSEGAISTLGRRATDARYDTAQRLLQQHRYTTLAPELDMMEHGFRASDVSSTHIIIESVDMLPCSDILLSGIVINLEQHIFHPPHS